MKKINHSKALLLSVGVASVFTGISIPKALAQSALQRCVRELVEVGVTPDAAAQQCIQGGGTGLTQKESCVERAQFRTYNGTASQRQDSKTEYIYPFLDIDDGDCWSDHRNLFNPKTICWSKAIRIRQMSEQDALQKCNGYSSGGGTFGAPTTGQQPLVQPIYPPYSTLGGNPQAIQQCMENLLYQTEIQKPFLSWICVANDVNCRTVRVRTGISEAAAVQACQNAR